MDAIKWLAKILIRDASAIFTCNTFEPAIVESAFAHVETHMRGDRKSLQNSSKTVAYDAINHHAESHYATKLISDYPE